jgi:type IV pilus assembly protein PilM
METGQGARWPGALRQGLAHGNGYQAGNLQRVLTRPAAMKEMTLSLSDIFKPRAPALFGVDISSSAVKMVELSSSGKSGIKLERYVIEPIPRDVLVEGKIEKPDVLAEILQKAAKHLGSRAKHVAAALPANAVITKKMVMSAKLRADELDTQVQSDAQQHVPFQMDEVNYDFIVLGPASNPEESEVFFAAARKEAVEDRVAVIEQAGLKARIMDSEQFAVQRAAIGALERAGEVLTDRNIALVDIGTNTTTVTVFRNGDQVFHREQAFGGAVLTSDIIQTFNVHPEEAEKMKVGKFPVPDDYVDRVLEPFMASVAQEIQLALQMFTTSTAYTTVEAVYLAGGSAGIEGMAQSVAAKLELPVNLLNPFYGMAVASSIKEEDLARDAGALMCACGLGLRRIAQ